MAVVLPKTPVVKAKRQSRSTKQDDSSPFRSESIKSTRSEESPVRHLRKRTARQEHPFKADKVEHELARKGLKVTEVDLKEKIQNAMKAQSKGLVEEEGEEHMHKKPRQSIKSNSASTKLERCAASSTIRTWFGEKPEANIPIKLSMTSVNGLFDKLEELWSWVLDGRSISYCIASFSWLGEDAKTFLLRGEDQTAFEELVNAARHVLVDKNGQDTISLHLSVFQN